MAFEWDPRKAESNFRKHGVRFTEAELVLEDELALTLCDDESDPGERRFVSIGTGFLGRVLVVVFAWRGENIRMISARVAEPHERKAYEGSR